MCVVGEQVRMEEVAEVLGGVGLFVVANLAWLVVEVGGGGPPLGLRGEEGEGFFFLGGCRGGSRGLLLRT